MSACAAGLAAVSTVVIDDTAGAMFNLQYVDLNGDGKMNTNPFGMPTEPFAFSNNAVGNMGPAGWDRAGFALSGDAVQSIDLK